MSQPTPGSYKAYHKASHTVGKTRQVVMLYDGAIRFVQQAMEAIEKRDYETRYHKLMRVSDIITGLQACLDFESGGAVAKMLYDFYAALDLRIFAIHRTNDLEACKQVIADLKKMRDAWDRIDRGELPQAMAPQSAADPSKPETDQPVTVSA